MKNMQIRLSLMLVVSICVWHAAALGQDVRDPFRGIDLSASLKKTLIDSLRAYVAYQRTEQWAEAERLLAGFQRDPNSARRIRYSTDEVTAIRDGMRELHLQGFTPQGVSFSTANLSRGLSGKAWLIVGCVEYLKNGERVQVKGLVNAYYDNGFVFSPMMILHTPDGDEMSCNQAF